MKEMAIHTRVNPKERINRLINFANRLLKTPDVNYLILFSLTRDTFKINVYSFFISL